MRLLEIVAFLTLSGALHVAALTIAPLQGGDKGGGNDGTSDVALQAATPTLAAMVADWDRPPDISDAPAMAQPEVPSIPERPAPETAVTGNTNGTLGAPTAAETLPTAETRLPAPPTPFTHPAPEALPIPDPVQPMALQSPAAPERPNTRLPSQQAAAPAPEAMPQVDTTPPQGQFAPSASLKPEKRPAVPRQQAAPEQTAARPAQKARDSGQQNSAGSAAQAHVRSPAKGPSKSQLVKLEQQWGAQITAALQRAHRPPRGTRATGTVKLLISIAPSGQVAGVSMVTSSGNARLDQAALAAVQRARFPRAPDGLTKSAYRFSQRLTVAR